MDGSTRTGHAHRGGRRRRDRAVTPHVEDRDRSDLAACLGEIDEALTELLEARGVKYVGEATCPVGRHPAGAHGQPPDAAASRRSARFVLPLARGELSAPLPSPTTRMAAPAGRDARAPQPAHPSDPGDRPRRLRAAHRLHGRVLGGVQRHGRRCSRSASARSPTRSPAARQAEDDLQRERDLLVAGPVVTFRWDVDDEGTVQYVSPNISAYGYTRRGVHQRPARRTRASSTPRTSAGSATTATTSPAPASRAGPRSTASPTRTARRTGSATSRTRCAATTAR